jgi:HK97 family phage portal protein
LGFTDALYSFFGIESRSVTPKDAESRSILENPNVPIDQNTLVGLLSGGPTSSGISVNEVSSLSSSCVYACVQVIAQEIASLPLYVYRNLKRGREKATDHPLYGLFRYSPNAEMSSYQFRYMLTEHLLLWGNAFAEIQRNGRGVPIALWPLMADRTAAVRLSDGTIKIKTRTPHGDVIFDKDQVLHIKNFLAPDGLNGLSTIQKHRQAIGLALALEEFGAGYFGKGLNPGGFLKLDKTLKKEERQAFRESVEAVIGGLRNAHRLGVLEYGMDFVPAAIKPNDSQFIESRKYQAIDIARIFRIPPHKVGITEASNKATVEQAALEIYSDTLRPHIENWEQELTLSLLTTDERDQYSISFYMDNILRGDSEARHKNYATGRQWGYYSINDVREMEGLNPIDGGDGYQLPLNMVDALSGKELGTQEPSKDPVNPEDDISARSIKVETAGKVLEFDPAELRKLKHRVQKRSVAERNRLTDAYKPLFKRAAESVSRYENKALTKLLEDADDLDTFISSINQVYDKLPDIIKREFNPLFYSFAAALQGVISDEVANGEPQDSNLSPELQKFLADYGDSLTNRWIRSSIGQLNELADQEDTELTDIEERLGEWGDTRADKVAGNESVRLNGAISRALYAFFGVSSIVWVTSAKPCPICVTLEGQEIETTGYFVKEGGEVDPDDGETTPLVTRTKISHPPLHEGCTCSIAAA